MLDDAWQRERGCGSRAGPQQERRHDQRQGQPEGGDEPGGGGAECGDHCQERPGPHRAGGLAVCLMVPPLRRIAGLGLTNRQNRFGSVRRVRVLVSAIVAALVLAAPAQAKLTKADRAAINRTLDTFVATAVRRHDVGKSYDLVTSQLRGGMTRAEWAKGDIPVYPYPARGTNWDDWYLDYALKNEVAFELVLQPERGHKADPISFSA
jgi:hypothetical protein